MTQRLNSSIELKLPSSSVSLTELLQIQHPSVFNFGPFTKKVFSFCSPGCQLTQSSQECVVGALVYTSPLVYAVAQQKSCKRCDRKHGAHNANSESLSGPLFAEHIYSIIQPQTKMLRCLLCVLSYSPSNMYSYYYLSIQELSLK